MAMLLIIIAIKPLLQAFHHLEKDYTYVLIKNFDP